MTASEHSDPRQIVAHGYDQIAEVYPDWAGQVRVEERERYTRILVDALPEGAAVLDLGCATGELLTRRLAERFAVTGVDISGRQIALARQYVPQANFVQADMTAIQFPPECFDGVAAFYSLTHLPRDEVPTLLGSIFAWLRPGGLFVASLGAGDDPGGVEEGWLGVPMYFSGFDSAANARLIEDAGFEIISVQEEAAEEDGIRITFLWVVARKPGGRA